MINFAYGFSPNLAAFASLNRPPFSALTIEQIEYLAELSGYHLENRGDDGLTLFHPDGKHGYDRGINVVWHVQVNGKWLRYYPCVQPFFIRGSNDKIFREMQEVLSDQLPRLGFQEVITIEMDEAALHLPEYFPDEGYVRVMYVSEFKAKYQDLYEFVKRIFERC